MQSNGNKAGPNMDNEQAESQNVPAPPHRPPMSCRLAGVDPDRGYNVGREEPKAPFRLMEPIL